MGSTIKLTNTREAILNVLKISDKPLSYEQIKSMLSLKMDKATFYRNIAKFEEAGLIQKIELEDRKWYFELTKTAHGHFLCQKCNQLMCIDLPVFEDTKKYQVASALLKGTCKKCLDD